MKTARPCWSAHRICFHAVLLVSLLVLGMYTEANAVQEIEAGDRIFIKGDQWVRNGTIDQLEGFDVIRLSSYLTRDQMQAITDTYHKKLMIGLAVPDTITAGALTPPNPHPSHPWVDPDTSVAMYERGDSTGVLTAFRDSIADWTTSGIEISAVYFNLEYSYDSLSVDLQNQYQPQDVADKYARLLRKYKEILCDVSPSTELWVYGSADYIHKGCDWDALTTTQSDTFAIDVCMVDAPIALSGLMSTRKTDVGTALHGVEDDANGKPVVFQIHTWPGQNYHLHWEDFKTLVKCAHDSSASSVYSMNNPIIYYKNHYAARDSASGQNVEYTVDSTGGLAPMTDIPWEEHLSYPARLWADANYAWQWHKPDNIRNRWEAEILANILVATGYPLPASSRQITSNTTWDPAIWPNGVTLLGDLEITNGARLTIDPGFTVKFRPDTDIYENAPSGGDAQQAEIIIQSGSTLSANASNGSQIAFQAVPADSGLWFGIRNLGGSLTLENCLIRDADVAVSVASGASGATVQDCEFTDDNQCIVALRGISTISGNQIWSSSQGIYMDHDDSQDIEHNLIYDNLNEAIYALCEPTVNVTNNTLDGNMYALRLSDPGGGDPMSVPVLNTILSNNTYGIYTEGYPDLTLRYSDTWRNTYICTGDLSWYDDPPNGETGNEGNIDLDPDFVSPSSGNYHLSTGSPCIDTGDPAMNDPDHSRIDMGRYGGTSGAPKPAIPPAAERDPSLPDTFAVSQNSPNPFNPSTTIDYALPMQAHVVLKIYNVLGQEVRTLVNGVVLPGYYQAVWDGRDAFGRPVSSGVYIYKIQAGTFLAVRKMIMLK